MASCGHSALGPCAGAQHDVAARPRRSCLDASGTTARDLGCRTGRRARGYGSVARNGGGENARGRDLSTLMIFRPSTVAEGGMRRSRRALGDFRSSTPAPLRRRSCLREADKVRSRPHRLGERLDAMHRSRSPTARRTAPPARSTPASPAPGENRQDDARPDTRRALGVRLYLGAAGPSSAAAASSTFLPRDRPSSRALSRRCASASSCAPARRGSQSPNAPRTRDQPISASPSAGSTGSSSSVVRAEVDARPVRGRPASARGRSASPRRRRRRRSGGTST